MRRLLTPLFLLLPAAAHAQSLGAYQSHAPDGRAILVAASSGAQLRVTPYGDFMLRVQVARAGEAFPAERFPDMVERHDWPGAITALDVGDAIELGAAAPGSAVMRLVKADLSFDFGLRGETEPRLSGGQVTLDPASVTQVFLHHSDEHFAGLGHGHFGRVPKLDLAGGTHVRRYGRMHGEQSPLIVPFYLSSRGYGVFFNSAADASFQLGEAARYAITLDAGPLDFFFIAGPRLLDVLDRYTELTGRPRLPPRAIFGLALSDKGAPAESQATWWQERVRAHRALGLPLDHLVNDNRWRAGGGERCLSRFDWDPVRYPDPAAFQRWLGVEGLIVTLDFNRCIANQSEGWSPEFNLPGTDGVEFGDSSPDLTNPDVRRWWWSLMFDKSIDPALGYPRDALWIDEFDELGLVPADTITADGRRWSEVRNLWFLFIADALGTQGWSRDVGAAQRPFIWVRGMTAGGQREATLWSGDLVSTYPEMALQVRGLQAAGLSGFPFWGHDAGGFNAEGVDEATFDLLYRQWALAFGSFTPYWRPHGVGPQRWPMDRSLASLVHAERYGELRMELMPYLYSYAHEASSKGAPLARALFLEYGNDERAWTYDLQYLWGRELLVAPVTGAGDTVASVWLPQWPGGGWYDFWTDDLHAAGGVVQTFAPTGRIPLFVRAGSVIPMAPNAESTAFQSGRVLDLHVYTGADALFTLYEDDGRTEADRTGALRTTQIEWSQSDRALRIRPATGTFDGAVESRRYRAHFHGVAAPPCASIDGAEIPPFHSLREAESHGAGSFPRSSPRSSGIGVVTREVAVGAAVEIRLGGECSVHPIRRFQAEAGRTSGTLGQKATASNGAYVGGLDLVGAYVEVDVDAASAGDYDLAIGFANGTTQWASRALYVNGAHVFDPAFPPSADWWRFAQTELLTVALQAGSNTLRLETEEGDRATLDLDYFEIVDGPPSPAAAFEMQAGLLTIEAEHLETMVPMGGHTFVPITRPHGFAGDGALISLPDVETNRDVDLAEGPRAGFSISLPAGTYQLWVRGHAYGDGDDDSLHAGLDGQPSAGAARISFTDAADWTWARGTLDVAQPGLHTLSIWMREDGAILDRFILAADPSFVPNGEGPPESPRVGEVVATPDAGVVVGPDAETSTAADGGVIVEAPDAGVDAGMKVLPPTDEESCACSSARSGGAPGSALGILAMLAACSIRISTRRRSTSRLAPTATSASPAAASRT